MAELAMLADIQRKVYPEAVTRQLNVMARQGRESLPVIDRRSNQLCYAANFAMAALSNGSRKSYTSHFATERISHIIR